MQRFLGRFSFSAAFPFSKRILNIFARIKRIYQNILLFYFFAQDFKNIAQHGVMAAIQKGSYNHGAIAKRPTTAVISEHF